MKYGILIVITLFFCSLLQGQQSMILEPPSNNTAQLLLRSFGPSAKQDFAFQVQNDGILKFLADGSTNVAEIDDDTGNFGVGTSFNTARKINTINAPSGTVNTPLYGVYSEAGGMGSGARYGIYGEASLTTGNRYGVYGRAGGSTGTGHWGVYCEGNLWYTGTITSTSDARYKSNVEDIDQSLDLIMQLKPRRYQFKTGVRGLSLSKGDQIGFLAQDLEKVIPELVETNMHDIIDESGVATEQVEIKGINYIGLIPVLTKAIQEQQAEIELLSRQVTELTVQLKSLTQNSN